MTFAFLYINIYHDYWNTEESQYTLIRFENKDEKSRCQDSDSYMITLPLGQTGGLEVKSFNVLHGTIATLTITSTYPFIQKNT